MNTSSTSPNAPDENAPDENAPDENAPDENAPDENAPDENAPDENAPDENAPDENAPDENAPDENADERNAGDDALDMLLGSAPDEPAAPIAQAQTAAATEVAAPAPQLDAPPAIAKLDEATRDLLMPSESDEPFRTVYWPLEKDEITPSEVALYLTENAEATVETQRVEEFFGDAATVEDWMDDEEKASAQRFAQLVEVIDAELGEPCVYRIGERAVTAAIIGKVAGGFAGVVTLVVET